MHSRNISSLILIIFLLTACAPSPTLAPAPSPIPPETGAPVNEATQPPAFPEAVQAVQESLAKQLGIETSEMEIIDYQSAEWQNSCLGWPGKDEVCLESITPGFGGAMRSGEQEFLFRTNQDGSIVRTLPSVAMAALQTLAKQTGIDPALLRFELIEQVDWPDACLGIQTPDQICAQVITPGYRIVIQAEGQAFEFHTNISGDQILEVSSMTQENQEAELIWSQDNEGKCIYAAFRPAGIEWGECAGEKQNIPYPSQQRLEDLLRFASLFAPFSAETQTGLVNFTGQGKITVTRSQERMFSKWAQLVIQEVQSGSVAADQWKLLTYSVQGGIAGRCEQSTIFTSGYALIQSCPGILPEKTGIVWLSDQQLQSIYYWADQLRSFDIEQTDLGMADALTTKISFWGAGETMATPIEQQTMANMAEEFITQTTLQPDPMKIEAARQVLIQYFDALNQGNYSDAARLYGGSYDVLRSNNPAISGDNFAGLFEAGCTLNGFICNLRIKNEVSVAQISPDTFRFSIELQNPDGSLFILGPCCGASEEESPPVSQFDYSVKQTDTGYMVMLLPVYMP